MIAHLDNHMQRGISKCRGRNRRGYVNRAKWNVDIDDYTFR